MAYKAEHFRVPAGVQSDPIIGEHQLPAFKIRKTSQHDDRRLGQFELARRGQPAGMILWESKRTKAWSDGWLAKLREDQRRCGADVATLSPSISSILI